VLVVRKVLPVLLSLVLVAVLAAPAGAEVSDRPSSPTAEAVPEGEPAPAPAGLPTRAPTVEASAGAEFNPLAGCPFLFPFLSLCTTDFIVHVVGRPASTGDFVFRVREFDGARQISSETRVATEAEPAESGVLSAFRSYRIDLVGSPGSAYTEVDAVACTGQLQHVVGDVAFVDAAGVTASLVECTFTLRDPGSIQVRQVTNSPSSDRPAFAYTTTGSGVSAFELDNDELGADRTSLPRTRTFDGLARGRRTFVATPRAGFRLTDITCTVPASIDLDARRASLFLFDGQDVSCTFTQTALASVRVTLDVRPDNPVDVAFDTTSLGPPSVVVLDDDGPAGSGRPNTRLFSGLLPGNHTITQGTDLSGQGIDLRSIACNGTVSSSSLATRTVTLRLDAGEDLVCTFRNEERGSISIVEDSLPDSATDYTYASTASPSTFTLDDDGNGTFPRSVTVPAVPAGTRHVITQGVPPGSPPWRLLSITCNTGEVTDVATRTATVTVDAGEDVTCTFANAQFQPDALIAPAAGGPFAGDEVRSPTVVAAQTLVKSVSAAGRQTVMFVRVQNDSGITDDLIVRTAESGQGLFLVSYRRGTEDITAAVLSPGGFVFRGVPPGGERVVVVTFLAQNASAPGSAKNANLSVTSAAAPAATDVVRARAERT